MEELTPNRVTGAAQALLLVLVVFLNLSPSQAGLVFDKPHLDIQAPVTVTQTEAIFPFHVEGTSEVTLKAIKSSCECTEGKTDKLSYKPGEQGELRAVFKHGERVGEQFKTITVKTDEPGGGAQKVSFKVVIPRVVEVSPVALFWATGSQRESKEIRIGFPDTEVRPVGVVLSGGQDHVDAILTCLEPGSKYLVTVRPRSTSSDWKEELVLEMDFGSELGVRKQICYAYVK